MKPTPTEARILANEDGLLIEALAEQLAGNDEVRIAFESGDDAFLGSLVKCAIRDYAQGLDDEESELPDEAEERLNEWLAELRREAARINAGRL